MEGCCLDKCTRISPRFCETYSGYVIRLTQDLMVSCTECDVRFQKQTLIAKRRFACQLCCDAAHNAACCAATLKSEVM